MCLMKDLCIFLIGQYGFPNEKTITGSHSLILMSGFTYTLMLYQGTKRITGQYSLLRTSAPHEVLVRTGQHWSVYTREASEIFKLSEC